MKTKLIQLTTDPNVGGGPRYIEGILKRLPQDEFEPYLVAPKGWLIDKIKSQKSNLKYKILNTENNTGEKVRQLRQLLIEIKQSGYPFAPMILHANSPQGVYLASQAIRGLGIYLVYTEHLWTLDYHLPSRIREWVQVAGLRSALKSASKVIVVSQAVNKFIIKHKITHKEKVEVIYPIVGEEGKVKVKKYSEKSNLPIAKDIYLGTIGGLNLVKGFHYLVEAVSMLKNDHPSIKLEIIGQGPEYENLKFQISKLKLTQNVKIITDAKSLNEYYDKWDIYLQPSLSETFGLSVYGAMRHGMAIIASRA
jgi:glycosyltransferase involved in cell wall biosynthesis